MEKSLPEGQDETISTQRNLDVHSSQKIDLLFSISVIKTELST